MKTQRGLSLSGIVSANAGCDKYYFRVSIFVVMYVPAQDVLVGMRQQAMVSGGKNDWSEPRRITGAALVTNFLRRG